MNLLLQPDQDWLASLNRHPDLKERINSWLSMVEDSEGDFEKADEAEWRIIQAVRQIGNKLLTSWSPSRINN